jgi:trans-aconitate 2-methyltransferase
MPTWDAAQYLRFDDLRTRPCGELAARIDVAAPSRVIDLGCGPGNSTAVLAKRWPVAHLHGLDTSPEMIAAARNASPKLNWLTGDVSAWADEAGPGWDIIFSNAALQWVENHQMVFPKLFARTTPGGALAVQMPGNFDAPAHSLMRELAQSSRWRSHFPAKGVREWGVLSLADYYDIIAPHAAAVDLWQTDYQHVLPDHEAIVEWYKGTGLRPFLDALSGDDVQASFTADYLRVIRKAYPLQRDGRIIFPFRRLFLIAYARPFSTNSILPGS